MPDLEINEHGNVITRRFFLDRTRYYYDFGECSSANGWQQYDTAQDAWYFGVWVHVEERKVLTWAEGDETLVECPSLESFRAQLDSMAEFYGDPPPAFTVIDFETETITEVYDTRPTV